MNDLVIIDTETTGWSPKFHRVIEVGAVKIHDGEIVDRYSTLVKTSAEISVFITRLTGITHSMLTTGGRAPQEVFTEVRDFIGNNIFVAHNVNFDYSFLNSEFGRYGLEPMSNPKICTVQIARKANLPIINFKLTTIKDYLGVDYQSHRALTDVMTCYELLKQVNYFGGN